jgi:hypothetical protein
MVADHYELIAYRKLTRFFFVSTGINGRVLKSVMFDRLGGNRWNFGFGDVKKDMKLDDKVITNNNDVAKVLGTVAQAALQFSKTYPKRVLVIYPVDERRKWLYNLVFQRRHAEIADFFTILGKIKHRKEAYDVARTYDSFELIRKMS